MLCLEGLILWLGLGVVPNLALLFWVLVLAELVGEDGVEEVRVEGWFRLSPCGLCEGGGDLGPGAGSASSPWWTRLLFVTFHLRHKVALPGRQHALPHGLVASCLSAFSQGTLRNPQFIYSVIE